MSRPRMRVAKLYVRLTSERAQDAESLRRAFANRPAPTAAPVPRSIRRRFKVERHELLGAPIFTLTPPRPSGTHIVYAHGGAYVRPLRMEHWWIIDALLRTTGATISVPLYPLAPEHTFETTYASLTAHYRTLLTQFPSDRIVLAGDSAGGALSLGQSLEFRRLGLPLPQRLILFAPWLDLALSNPDAEAVQPEDRMLDVGELRELGRWWAGGTDPRDPRLSPLFGELRGLPPVHIFQGTADVLWPDARLLRDRLQSAGTEVEFVEVPGAFHVYMGATFAPEARAVFKHVGEVLTR